MKNSVVVLNGIQLVFSRENGAVPSLTGPEGHRLIDVSPALGG